MSHRVFVTGMGLYTALGKTASENWHNLLNGMSGIEKEFLGSQSFPKEFPRARISIETNGIPRVEYFLTQAVKEAIADAWLSIPLKDCGVVVGSSRGYQAEIESALQGGDSAFPFFFPGMLSAAIATQIQSQSITLAPMAACATGNWAIAQAYELIQMEKCERVVVGASDAALTSLSMAGFGKLGALAKAGLYPFSEAREGLVLGEGAAALVLESETCWRKRSHPRAKVYGEVLGFGISNDAFHPTSPQLDHGGAEAAIFDCLQRINLTSAEIDLISAHGTGTQLNDRYEASLIQRLFAHSPWVMATKGATGHVLGATALIEAAFCLLALAEQKIPPYVGRSPLIEHLNLSQAFQSVSLRNVLNFSFGFGGQNAIVAFASVSLSDLTSHPTPK